MQVAVTNEKIYQREMDKKHSLNQKLSLIVPCGSKQSHSSLVLGYGWKRIEYGAPTASHKECNRGQRLRESKNLLGWYCGEHPDRQVFKSPKKS
jgi:hypothetical protein